MRPAMPGQALSDRELQVLQGFAEGKRKAEIARGLFLAPPTVHTHAQRMRTKLSARNAAHAVALAYQEGILTVERAE